MPQTFTASKVRAPFALPHITVRGFNSSNVGELKGIRGMNGGGNGNIGSLHMTDEPEIKKYILPDAAVDAIVKAERDKYIVYEAESRQRLAFCKEDLEMRKKVGNTYNLVFMAIVYQSVLFTAAFAWWVLK